MENKPTYDGPSDRFYDGDEPLPRSDAEAVAMGLSYDPETNAWYSGDTLVVSQETIDRYEAME